jgi:tRNA threonylcarbamoyl adenosine modification protein YeaZ
VLLLALDSAEAACSVALWDSARPEPAALLGHRRLAGARSQADRLIELIDDLMSAAGLDYHALDVIAVDHGPGSFTGVRTAVAAARGLALAAALPVFAVTSLETLAAAVPDAAAGALVAALDARRGEVYVQIFDRPGQPRTAPAVVAPQRFARSLDAEPLRLVGSGAMPIRAALPADRPVIIEEATLDARWVARRAAQRLAGGAIPRPGSTLRPLYLRPPDARPQAPRVAPAAVQAVEA